MAIQLFVLMPPALLAFVFYLINKEELLTKFWVNVALWLPPIIMLMLLWGTDLVTVNGITHAVDSGFRYMTYPNGPLSNIKSAYTGIGFVLPPIILAIHLRRIRQTIRRREIGIILLGLVPPVLGGMIFEGILPSLGHKTLPMGAILVSITDIVIVYAILRYGLYIFNVRSAIPTIVGAMPNGLIVLDHTNTIQYVNHGASELLGYTERALINTPVEKLFGSRNNYKAFTEQAEALNNEANVVIPDTFLVGKGQTHIPVTLNLASINEKKGELTNIVVVVSDISKLKLVETQLEKEKTNVERKVIERTRQLSEAQAQLKASVSSLPFGFALIGKEGEIIFNNTILAKLFNRTIPSEPDDTKAVLHEIAAAYKPAIDIIHCIELTQSRLHAIERNIELGPVFLRFLFIPVVAEGQAIGTVLLLEDTTEQKALERSRDEFFSIASHELRTPLSAIRGNSSMVLQYYSDNLKDPSMKQMIDDIHTSSTRLITIVNDFLDMSRLEQNRIVFKPTSFVINELIQHTIKEYEVTSSRRKIALSLEPSADIYVYADADRTRQILINLISNAIKFTERGSVTFSLSHSKITQR